MAQSALEARVGAALFIGTTRSVYCREYPSREAALYATGDRAMSRGNRRGRQIVPVTPDDPERSFRYDPTNFHLNDDSQ
jgi:hypothetical protein